MLIYRRASILALGAGIALAALTVPAARAAKQWDTYTAITFTVTGSADPLAPSNVGANGTQTHTYMITDYDDVDHWIDPDESAPNNQGHPDEQLPGSDIDYSTDSPATLTFDGTSQFVFTAPAQAGDYDIYITGTDRDQVIPPGETGNRNDSDDTDNWWNLPTGD
jgi:hypothetical protein